MSTVRAVAINRKLLEKMVRYFLVGGIAALVDWVMFALMHFVLELNYVLSAVLAFVFALAVNYVLGLKMVFTGGRHRRETEILLVTLVSIAGAGINVGTLVVLVEGFAWHTMIAKVAGTGAAFLWNFYARHRWIFHPH